VERDKIVEGEQLTAQVVRPDTVFFAVSMHVLAVVPTKCLQKGMLTVDFAGVLERISSFLTQRDFKHALIGGLGMAAYGRIRTTLDLDIVVTHDAQDSLIAYMESEGYKTLYRSPGYSNHLHRDPQMGRVDFVYVEDETSRQLFPAARTVRGPGGFNVLVPKPEHIAAMKVVAMKHDPGRIFHELDDIRSLLTLPDVDPEEIRGYFEKHGMGETYEQLKQTLR
jgi:hypothetical protein